MEYPGNAALPDDIKERIVATFEQTLESFKQGKANEALLGCDFILKLDPEFRPARELTEKLQQSSSAAPASTSGAEIEALVKERRFKEALDLGRSNAALVAGDPSIAASLAQAQELMEAAPYVSSFLDSAEAALEGGGVDEASALLEKARALDPQHPRLAKLASALAVASGLPAAPASSAESSSSSFSLDFDEPVTSFRLGGSSEEEDPASPHRPEAAPPADQPVAPASAPEAPQLDLPSLDDDPLASLGQEVAPPDNEPAVPPEINIKESLGEDTAVLPDDEDPFAGLASMPETLADPAAEAFDPLGSMDLDTQPAADSFSLEEDPLAFGAVPEAGLPGGELGGDELQANELQDDELQDDEVAGDPFDLLTMSGEGDLLTAEASSEGGSGDRVQDLLNDGQAAFDRGDHQGAIDAWSRIFLIDIDNEEASRRIEQARNLKAEGERAVEEVFHEGLDAWNAGDAEKARAAFEKVLELQPGHGAAQEQLDQLMAGEASPAASTAGGDSLGSSLADAGAPAPPAGGDLLEEIMIPPAPGELESGAGAGAPSAGSGRGKGGRAKRGRSPLLAVGLAVLILVLGGGWYVFTHFSSLFPNAGNDSTATQPPPRLNRIQRAEKLHADGKVEQAIAQLKRVPATSPHHEKAQELIAEWTAVEPEPEPGLAPELVAQRAQLVAEATSYAEAGEFLRVRDALLEAEKISPLGADEEALEKLAADSLQPLESAFKLMEEREWTYALQDLWRRHAATPGNPDIRRLIVDCYYNLGVRELQRGNQSDAIESFREAVKMNPDDEELARHLEFSETYTNRPTDLLYRIYVKYLPYRST